MVSQRLVWSHTTIQTLSVPIKSVSGVYSTQISLPFTVVLAVPLAGLVGEQGLAVKVSP